MCSPFVKASVINSSTGSKTREIDALQSTGANLEGLAFARNLVFIEVEICKMHTVES